MGLEEDDKNMRRNNMNNKLMTSMPGNFSSGTTQKMASQYPNSGDTQKLPIISTRRAHLTVDQRVWDAEQATQNVNNSFPNDLHNSATLNENLVTHGSDADAYPS